MLWAILYQPMSLKRDAGETDFDREFEQAYIFKEAGINSGLRDAITQTIMVSCGSVIKVACTVISGFPG